MCNIFPTLQGHSSMLLFFLPIVHVEVVSQPDVVPGQRVLRAHQEAVANVCIVTAVRVVVVELIAAPQVVAIVAEAEHVLEPDQVVGPALGLGVQQ